MNEEEPVDEGKPIDEGEPTDEEIVIEGAVDENEWVTNNHVDRGVHVHVHALFHTVVDMEPTVDLLNGIVILAMDPTHMPTEADDTLVLAVAPILAATPIHVIRSWALTQPIRLQGRSLTTIIFVSTRVWRKLNVDSWMFPTDAERVNYMLSQTAAFLWNEI